MNAMLRKLESAMERAKDSQFQFADVKAVTVEELEFLIEKVKYAMKLAGNAV